MKIIRKLTIPTRRETGEVEYSGFEIELSEEELNEDSKRQYGNSLQDKLQVMCREAQARVLACHVADGNMTNEEMTRRLTGFLGPTPEWLNNLQKLEPPKAQ